MTGGAARATCVLAFALTLLPACAPTVVEDTTPSTATAPPNATTSTVPLPSTAVARIEQIVELSRGLGNLIVDGGDDEVIERIDALWAASEGEVGDREPALGREIVHQLALLHLGVERNRPAEADKASQNLAAVLQAYLERQPA